MVNYLSAKFQDRVSPTYNFDEIFVEELEFERENSRRKVFPTIGGSSTFQMMVFQPNAKEFKAAPHLCICEKCKKQYGLCELFQSFPLVVHQMNNTCLRSADTTEPVLEQQNDDNIVLEFMVPESVVGVAADKKSIDTIWFIVVKETICVLETDSTDSYGHKVHAGMQFNKGHFLELQNYTLKHRILNNQRRQPSTKKVSFTPSLTLKTRKKDSS